MRFKKASAHEGQTLVQLALMLTVLMAFAALAVDFGRVYMERRRLQNAADAGALAAGRARCFGGVGGTYGTVAQAYAAGELYATSLEYNGAPAADVSSMDGWTYTVTTSKDVEMTFASVVGLSTVPVRALAAAKCGGATSGCGFWPVTLSESQWDQMYEAACKNGKPQTLYVWASLHSGKQNCDDPLDPTCCVDDPSNPGACMGTCTDNNCKDPNCGIDYDCDVNNDGIDDVFADQGRGWLDFTGFQDPNNPSGDCPKTGCGASELGDCLSGDPNVKLTVPFCMSGDRGVKGGVKRAVETRAGDTIGFPVFEKFCPNPGECHDGFFIKSFGCMQVDDKKPWYHLVLNAINPNVPQKWHAWVIRSTVACSGCATNCGGTSTGAPTPEPGGVRAVSLVK